MDKSQGSPEELFSAPIAKDADSLIMLGYIEETVEFVGYSFTLKSLNGEEELLASLVAKEYLETFAQLKGWAWANIGLALIAVNGDPDFCPPISHNPLDFAKQRFRYVTKWAWPLGEFLFAEYKKVEARRDAVIEELQGKSQGSHQIYSAWRDSSNEQDGFESNHEILDHLD